MHKKITLYTVLTLTTMMVSLPSANASQVWQSFCSNMKADSVKQTDNRIDITNYTVTASDLPSVTMHASMMNTSQEGTNLSQDQMTRIGNITSTALMTLILNHQMNKCSKQYYIDTLTPALNSVKKNGSISFNWKNVTFNNGNSSFKANQMSLTLKGQTGAVNATVRFSGLSGNPKNVLKALFPNQGNIDLTTNEQTFPLILAATSGNTDDVSRNQILPIKVNALTLQNATSKITAQGDMTLNTKLRLTSALGKITISNIDDLITASKSFSNSRIKTALILIKFAGSSVGDNILQWNIDWEGNLLKVNNIPIPIW